MDTEADERHVDIPIEDECEQVLSNYTFDETSVQAKEDEAVGELLGLPASHQNHRDNGHVLEDGVQPLAEASGHMVNGGSLSTGRANPPVSLNALSDAVTTAEVRAPPREATLDVEEGEMHADSLSTVRQAVRMHQSLQRAPPTPEQNSPQSLTSRGICSAPWRKGMTL